MKTELTTEEKKKRISRFPWWHKKKSSKNPIWSSWYTANCFQSHLRFTYTHTHSQTQMENRAAMSDCLSAGGLASHPRVDETSRPTEKEPNKNIGAEHQNEIIIYFACKKRSWRGHGWVKPSFRHVLHFIEKMETEHLCLNEQPGGFFLHFPMPFWEKPVPIISVHWWQE